MANITGVTPPPINSPMIFGASNLVSNPWVQWFTSLYIINVQNIASASYVLNTANSLLTGGQVLADLTSGFMTVTAGTGIIGSTGSSKIRTSDLTTTGVAAGDYSINSMPLFSVGADGRLTSANHVTNITPTGTAGGDLAGSYPNPTIALGVVTEAMQLLADNTTQNVSTSAHGYTPKLDNSAAHYLSGKGLWVTPTIAFSGDSGTFPFSTSSVTITGGTSGMTFACAGSTMTLGGDLKLAFGGTNNNLTASLGGIVYSNSTQLAILAGIARTGSLLLSGASTTPSWSTTTYPATNAINTLLYASSANVMAALATANSAVLVTSAVGVPSFSTTLPNIAIGTPTSGTLTNCSGYTIPTAVKSDQTTGSSNTVYVTPGVQQYHNSALKAWVNFVWNGLAIVISGSYNVTSVTRTSAGLYVINLTTAFTSVNTMAPSIAPSDSASYYIYNINSVTTSSITISLVSTLLVAGDPNQAVYVQIAGTQ